MDSLDTVVICRSPRAGSGARRGVVEEIFTRTTALGLTIHISDSIDEIRTLVNKAIADGRLRTVVSVGGDGTLGLLVRNLPVATPFLPVPLGTENLLAKKYGYSWNPSDVTSAIQRHETFTIDAGLAGDDLFLIMATAGFDAEVTRAMSLVRQGHISRWSYVRPIWATMRNYTYPQVTVHGHGFPEEGLEAPWIMAFNLPQYALGLSLVHDCSETDGMLDTCVLMKPGFLSGVGYLANVILARHQHLPSVRFVRSPVMTWESKIAVPYQLDGDFVGYLPIKISVLPNRVTLVAK